MQELVYCATPSRLSYKMNDIMNFVSDQGKGPFHPFQAFPYERFEGGIIGREKSMEFCRRAIGICDEIYLFGVSEGTLDDLLEGRKQKKPVSEFVEKFDPEWRRYYQLFVVNPKYKDVILGLLGKK